MNKKLIVIVLGYLFILFLISRIFFGSKGEEKQEEQKVQVPLANSYILIMHQDANQPATNRRYVLQSQSNADEVIYKFEESSQWNPWKKPREGIIRFNPHTLKGNWVSTKTGSNDVQGGEILLAHKDHGFDIKLTYTQGRSAVVTESYGSLVVHH